ncbi:MAG TPA: DMT family transporter [Elusimicrobiota bacterium]|jgi:drug/metabolite transporter (DMT)-like permease|nr:DMT family transporter [Elusimicrobiota bacterium]
MRVRNAARLRLLAAAALFSTGGALIKSCAFNGWQVAGLRSAIASVTILAVAPAARRRWSWRVFLVGAAYAATLVLYVIGNKLTTAASAIYLQATAPLYLLVLAPLLLKEPLSARDGKFMLALGAGMLLLLAGTEAPRATAPDPVHGNMLALASGVTWALTLLGLRWMGRFGDDAVAATAAGNLLAALVCAPWALPLPPAPAADWARIVFLGVVQIGLAYALLARGIREVPALESSLLVLLEPVLNPIWAWLVHGETLGPLTALGAAAIFGATTAHVAAGFRGRKPLEQSALPFVPD